MATPKVICYFTIVRPYTGNIGSLRNDKLPKRLNILIFFLNIAIIYSCIYAHVPHLLYINLFCFKFRFPVLFDIEKQVPMMCDSNLQIKLILLNRNYLYIYSVFSARKWPSIVTIVI